MRHNTITMKKYAFLALVIGAISLTSCKKDEVEPTDNNTNTNTTVDTTMYLLSSGTTTNGETVELYALDQQLTTGYTQLFAKVKDATGAVMPSATVTFSPLMDMGTMQHSAPVIAPTYNSTTQTYAGVVVFQMSSLGGTWTMDVSVDGSPVTFNLTVDESATKVVGVYTGTDGVNYVVSLARPVEWNVGMNDLILMVHKKESMMSWPAVEDLEIVLDPEMVSMGHGSPNNVSPVHIANGYYQGEVNFTMTGDWRLHLQLLRNSVEIHSDAYLDILF